MHALCLVGVIVVASYMVTRMMIEMISIYCYDYDYSCANLVDLADEISSPKLY